MKNITDIKRPTATIITALFLSLASNMAMADVDKSLAAYKKQDYATALKEFEHAAQQGYAQAQFFLGDMYEYGRGVIQNEGTAVEWYQKAAEQGHAQAQYYLGNMYADGRGVAKNISTAYFWWLIASANANGVAKKGIEMAEKELSPEQKQQVQDAVAKW
jgi:TPR repeat protein